MMIGTAQSNNRNRQLVSKVWIFLLCFFTLIAVSGCEDKTMHVSPWPKKPLSEPTKLVPYYLPKTVFKITLAYSIGSRISYSDGVPQAKSSVNFGSIQVDTVNIPDPRYRLLISGDDLESDPLLDTQQAITLNDDGTLQSVNVTATDKTMEVVENLITTGLKLAATAAAFSKEQDPTVIELRKRIEQTYKEIASASDDKQLDELSNRLTTLKGLLSDYEADHSKSDDRSITLIEDPSTWTEKATADGDGSVLIHTISLSDDPKAMLAITLRIPRDAAHVETGLHGNDELKQQDGILFRLPVISQATVEFNNERVFQSPVSLMQVGDLGLAAIRSRHFAARTDNITLGLAGVQTRTRNIGSSAAGFAAGASSISSNLGTQIAEVENARANKQLADLQLRTQLLEAQAALIKAQQDLAALRKK
jgi:hypothetical protein